MKMYVEKESILPGEESQAENNQTSKKDLPNAWKAGKGEGDRLISFGMESREGAATAEDLERSGGGGEGETEIEAVGAEKGTSFI